MGEEKEEFLFKDINKIYEELLSDLINHGPEIKANLELFFYQTMESLMSWIFIPR